jgi:hypothetical protein
LFYYGQFAICFYEELIHMLLLNIRQQYAKLGLDIQDPALKLRTTQPKIEMATQAATVEIHQQPGVLEIDQTPCRYSIGLKNLHDFSRDNAEEGKQRAQEAIVKIAEEGDRLAQIEKKGNPIAEMGAEAIVEEPKEITWAHIDAPIINYQPGKVEYNPIRGRVDLQLQRGTVDNESQRGTVEGYIAQRQSIRMWTTENKYDLYV